MAISREYMGLTLADVEDPDLLVNRVNFILGRLMDRIDQLEAIRGKAQIRGELQIIDPDSEMVVGGFTDGSA